MTFTRSFMVALVGAALAGCGLFGSSSPTPSRPEPRRLHITLVGGGQLNPGPSGRPNPIQTCIYVVRSAGWAPLGDAGDTRCAGSRDDAVAASSRQVIAPNQVLQLSLDPATQDELWLMVDADYARRPPHYAPLRMHVDGSGLIHYAVWLDGSGIYDALRPGPVPVGAIAVAAGAAALAVGAAVSGGSELVAPARAGSAPRSLLPSRMGRMRPGLPSAKPQVPAAPPPQDLAAPPAPAAAPAAPASEPQVTHFKSNPPLPPGALAPASQPAAQPAQTKPWRYVPPKSDRSAAPADSGSGKPPRADFVIDKSDVKRIDSKSRRLRSDLLPGLVP